MKRLYPVLLLCFFVLSVWGQKDKDFVKIPIHNFNYKNKLLFASKYEVSNKQYQQFLSALLQTGQKDKYLVCLYDSLGWTNKIAGLNDELSLQYYASHPVFDKYPVVNITKQAAEFYCEWLTGEYQKRKDKKFSKVVFRLPNEEEWVYLASPLPNHNLPWVGNLPYTSPSLKPFFCNIKLHSYNEADKPHYSCFECDDYPYTAPTKSFHPNKIGIYNTIGNVAEITQSGAIKGGSWYDWLEDCTVNKTQDYSLPDPRVGFRVVMEIIEK